MRRADFSSIRAHNRLLLLRLIREHQPVRMSTLARMTGLQPSTVLRLVRQLRRQRLIEGTGPVSPGGGSGRPAMQWALQGSTVASAGIHLAWNMVTGVAVNLRGDVLASSAVPLSTRARRDEEEIAAAIQKTVAAVTDRRRLGKRRLAGVGIASMGLVSRAAVRVRYFERELDFERLVPRRLRPILVENDANAVALGEVEHGVLAGVRNAVVLYVHAGIGAGLVVDGRLVRGKSGAAGEVSWRDCTLLPNPMRHPAPEVFEEVARGVCALINLLNPEVCLLAGNVHELREALLPRIDVALRRWTNPVARDVRIEATTCDPMRVAVHMATVVLDERVFQHHQAERTPGEDRLEVARTLPLET